MSMMSVRPVGPYPNAYSAPAYNAQPAAQTAVQPSAAATPTGGAASSGLNLGRLASWAGGGWLGFRVAETVMRSRPEGWLLAGVVGAGAFVGNKLYNTVTGSGSGLSMPSANGNTGRYLAWGGLVVLAAYAPLLLLLGTGGLPLTWALFGAGFIGTRALVLVLRARSDRWMVAGPGRPRVGA